MEIDLQKTESEYLQSSNKEPGAIGKTIAILSLSSTKFTIAAIAILSGILISFCVLYSQSIILAAAILFTGFCCLSLGALITGFKFSSGLQMAKTHLAETSEVLKLNDEIIRPQNSNITGIPAIDSLYELAESAALAPEQELSRVREELSLVLNNIAAAVILYGDSGEVKFCSPYIQVLTGYGEEELSWNINDLSTNKKEDEGDFLKQVIIEQDWQRYKRARLVSHLGEDSLVRFRIKHKSGLQLWLESRMVPIIDSSGEVLSVLTITIDVTDSINYQKQIEQQNQDLSDFAYMVSHDLKAPIFTIHGMADALKDDYSSLLPDDARELLTFITDAAKRLDKLVASVLEYSALSNANETQAEVNLNETIQQVLSDHKEQLKPFESTITIKDELPTIKADPIRVYQVFSNLIGNAIKYRDPSRPLNINIIYKNLPPHLVEIEIRDNGLGIPKNKLTEIFRPYRRAHGGDIEGSGVGLACVKKIVEKLGGQVSVESNEGVGSSFFVALPLSKPARRTIPEDLERLY